MTRLAMQRRLAAALPVAGIVAVLVGLFLTSGDMSEPRRPLAARAVAPLPTALFPPPAPRASMKRVSSGGTRDEIQICGGAWVAVDADGAPEERALEAAFRTQERDLERRILDSQESSADPRHRAAALWHRLLRGLEPTVNAPPAGPSADVGATQDRLVTLALDSRDPDVYGSAIGVCNERPALPGAPVVPRTPRCDLLSAAQWAQLDSDNGLPWLAAAEEARQRGDTAAEEEALWRAAHAKRFRSLLRSAVGGVVRHLPAEGVHGIVIAGAVAGAFGQHALVDPGSPGQRSCSEAAVGEPRRRDVCAAVAERLVGESDNLQHRKHGIAIGRRVGWSEERMRTLADEERAFGLGLARPAEAEKDPWGCKGAREVVEKARLVAELGEIGAIRQAVADPPISASVAVSLTPQRPVGR